MDTRGLAGFGIAVGARAERAVRLDLSQQLVVCIRLGCSLRLTSIRLKRRCLFIASVRVPIDCSSLEAEVNFFRESSGLRSVLSKGTDSVNIGVGKIRIILSKRAES